MDLLGASGSWGTFGVPSFRTARVQVGPFAGRGILPAIADSCVLVSLAAARGEARKCSC